MSDPGSGPPPNYPLKAAATVLIALLGCAVIVSGAVRGSVVLIVIGVAIVLPFPFRLHALRTGRNPWWNRVPLDYFLRRDRTR